MKCLWTLQGGAASAPAERILPDGSFEIIFHLGDPFTQSGTPQPHSMLMGEINRAVVIRPSAHANVLGIRFRPGGARSFFRMPMRELRGVVAPLDDIIRGLETPRSVAAAQEMLIARLAPPSRTVLHAVDLIQSRNGNVRVRDLATQVGTTERTLERAFDAHVGVGPKMFARIARLQATLRGEDAGYYDDAHRLHEFRELAGVSRSDFLRERNEMNAAIVGNLQDGSATDR